ncbi:reverse transcriptase-rnase h-integrase [Moniliophthora roreri MCA 2997]|uniref:Reverse transcriptase-rnase h-integrase n=1 Tax=Moniliophthora roreri (strain MCA 2997) TaxID=1381753 RepID=V2WQ42_MONRO|nr:reverse transcriptase-rnase h-integrase [Moniliophthora roreri MCA 2997]
MSTAFHPQTDGASEHSIRNCNQILRATIQPNQRNWLNKLPIVEFAINSSISETTGFSPFELNYGYLPTMMWEVHYVKKVPPGVHAFAIQAMQNLYDAHNSIIEAQVSQTHYSNKKRRPDPEIKEGSKVYLLTKNLNMPKDCTTKLCPKYIGPYLVIKAYPTSSTYELELPEDLKKHRIHPVFHVSLLWPHGENDEILFPNRSKAEPYDFGAPPDTEFFVDSIEGHEWRQDGIYFTIWWTLGDLTWQPYTDVKELRALDEYLRITGVKRWQDLPYAEPQGPCKPKHSTRHK